MKTIILTYYVPVDGLNGEEAFKFIEHYQTTVPEIPLTKGGCTNVVRQFLPVLNSPAKFQVDEFIS